MRRVLPVCRRTAKDRWCPSRWTRQPTMNAPTWAEECKPRVTTWHGSSRVPTKAWMASISHQRPAMLNLPVAGRRVLAASTKLADTISIPNAQWHDLLQLQSFRPDHGSSQLALASELTSASGDRRSREIPLYSDARFTGEVFRSGGPLHLSFCSIRLLPELSRAWRLVVPAIVLRIESGHLAMTTWTKSLRHSALGGVPDAGGLYRAVLPMMNSPL